MTEPNVVRTRRQRIEIGNPGTWSGPLPVRYSKSNFFFSKCVVMRRDLYIPRRDRSKMRHDRYYIKTTVFMIQYCRVHVHFQVRRDASRSMHTPSRSFINASRSIHKRSRPFFSQILLLSNWLTTRIRLSGVPSTFGETTPGAQRYCHWEDGSHQHLQVLQLMPVPSPNNTNYLQLLQKRMGPETKRGRKFWTELCPIVQMFKAVRLLIMTVSGL